MKTVIYDFNGIRAPLTGIGRYATELIRPRSEHNYPVSVFWKQREYSNQDRSELIHSLELPGNFRSTTLRNCFGKTPFSRSLIRRARRSAFQRLAVFHLQNGAICHDINYGFNPGEGAQVTTVYDLSHLHYPETHPKHRVRFLENYFNKLANSDCRIITISNTIETELVRDLGISSDRITVTPLAADTKFKPYPVQDVETTLQQYRLNQGAYTLSVGTLEPRKNLATTIKAFCALDTDLQKKYPLVIIGAVGWKSKTLEQLTEKLETRGRIRMLGYVPQKDLPFLYAGAAAFVYPSLYEGFGLPVLEAMQSGCPVITSNSGALSEVCGDGGIQIESTDHDQLASHLACLLNDSEFRNRQSKAALRRAKAFSWSATIEKTHAIYDEL